MTLVSLFFRNLFRFGFAFLKFKRAASKHRASKNCIIPPIGFIELLTRRFELDEVNKFLANDLAETFVNSRGIKFHSDASSVTRSDVHKHALLIVIITKVPDSLIYDNL